MENSKEVEMLQDGLIVLMTDMVAAHDYNTGAHCKRTTVYVRIILEGLKRKGYYEEILTPEYIDNVVKTAPLHAIGKIYIPDMILNKPMRLTLEEDEIMKSHTIRGKELLDKAIGLVEGESFLAEARNMAAYYHECWDGSGYPNGLREDKIPLSARIMAVANAFDELTSPHGYMPAFEVSQALDMIKGGEGTQFDPKIVEVLIDSQSELQEFLNH